MSVLARHRAPLSRAQYDESAPMLIPLLKAQPGFVSHAYYEDADGFLVDEVWETQEQHDAGSRRTRSQTSRSRSRRK